MQKEMWLPEFLIGIPEPGTGCDRELFAVFCQMMNTFLRKRVEQIQSTIVLLNATPLMWQCVEIFPESSIGFSFILLIRTATIKNKSTCTFFKRFSWNIRGVQIRYLQHASILNQKSSCLILNSFSSAEVRDRYCTFLDILSYFISVVLELL